MNANLKTEITRVVDGLTNKVTEFKDWVAAPNASFKTLSRMSMRDAIIAQETLIRVSRFLRDSFTSSSDADITGFFSEELTTLVAEMCETTMCERTREDEAVLEAKRRYALCIKNFQKLL
jgi:hypothetical protein